jgi:hypothetical protein
MKNRLIDFLKYDLQQIESNEDLMNYDIMQDFVSYWQEHCEQLRDD